MSRSVNANTKLIISTGDISDIDGFFALAEYAKTGADVLFIMNYPAYLGTSEEESDATFESAHPGLGYKYSAKDVFDKAPHPAPQEYVDFLKQYQDLAGNELMKAAMTDLAFAMCKGVWSEASEQQGNLYFGIGGINAINPFSSTAIKNEILVYSKVIKRSEYRLKADEGSVYNLEGEGQRLLLSDYADIYMDFNGSMAFLNDDWMSHLNAAADKLRGAFVMGGVYAQQPPQTMPAIPNVLNRFSSATMNQLYHPSRSASFFEFIDKHQIPCFTVTNNIVADLSTFSDAEKKLKTMDGIHRLLHSNKIDAALLHSLAECYYTSHYNPPRKAFDLYTAVALRRQLESPGDLTWTEKRLFCSGAYGTTFVSTSSSWDETLSSYLASIDTVDKEDDPPFVKTKKLNFRREMEVMKSMSAAEAAAAGALPPGAAGPRPPRAVAVRDLSFTLEELSKELTVMVAAAAGRRQGKGLVVEVPRCGAAAAAGQLSPAVRAVR